MLEVRLLYLIIPGRINFLQLDRYGRFDEQRHRQQFGHKFDWLSFYANLAQSHIGNRIAIAFDNSYISKSGKCDPHDLKCDPAPCWLGDSLNRGYCGWTELSIGKFCACKDRL